MSGDDLPLSASVENGTLVIRIGIATLAFSANPKNGGVLMDAIVSDDEGFAKEVAERMMDASELENNSPLGEFLDEIIADIGSFGSESIQSVPGYN